MTLLSNYHLVNIGWKTWLFFWITELAPRVIWCHLQDQNQLLSAALKINKCQAKITSRKLKIKGCRVDKCKSAIQFCKKNGNLDIKECTVPSAVRTAVFEERYLSAYERFGGNIFLTGDIRP